MRTYECRAQKKLYYSLQKPEKRAMQLTETFRLGRFCIAFTLLVACSQLAVGADPSSTGAGTATPPRGFTALFNGQDLDRKSVV